MRWERSTERHGPINFGLVPFTENSTWTVSVHLGSKQRGHCIQNTCPRQLKYDVYGQTWNIKVPSNTMLWVEMSTYRFCISTELPMYSFNFSNSLFSFLYFCSHHRRFFLMPAKKLCWFYISSHDSRPTLCCGTKNNKVGKSIADGYGREQRVGLLRRLGSSPFKLNAYTQSVSLSWDIVSLTFHSELTLELFWHF